MKKQSGRRIAAFVTAALLCLLSVFPSSADITSDTPQISDTPVITSPKEETVIALPKETEAETGSSAAPIITDTPVLGGTTTTTATTATAATASGTDSVSAAPSETEAAGITAGAKPAETKSTSSQTRSDGTVLSDSPDAAGSAKGGEITAAPVAVSTAQTEAPKTVTAAASSETAKGPSSGKTSTEPGSVYANDAVTRVNLDFSLISPTHKKGVLTVSKAKVQLENGSWQSFDYSDNVHYAFYRLSSTQNDREGTWYVADVKARRFGDTNTEDGKFKTELWLSSSDCITRSTIDINTTSEKRIQVVKTALSLLGKQYIYGANGPDAYDCSGLVKQVFQEAGITVPRTSTQLLQLDGQITASELRPGDIMARAGHCGIYIGNGIFVHASDSSVGVVAEYLSVYNMSNKFTHYINVFGD